MADDPHPTLHFRHGAHGLLIPVGTTVGSTFFPSDISSYSQGLRESLLRMRVGTVPEFKHIWPDEDVTPESLFAAAPRERWLSFLGRFAICGCSPCIAPREFDQSILDILSPDQRQRLSAELGHATNVRMLDGFAVLLAIEIASFMGSSEPDHVGMTQEDMQQLLKPLFYLSQELHSRIASQISQSPGGTAASLAERSLLGDPRQLLTRAFDVWVNQHFRLSTDAKQFRQRVNAVMHESLGVDLSSWVGSIALFSVIYLTQEMSDLKKRALAVHIDDLGLSDEGLKALKAVLSRVSQSAEALGAECRSLHDSTPLWERPSLEPLRKHPCVYSGRNTSEVSVLSLIHLAQGALEEPIRMLKEAGETNPYQGFGIIVEDHVHHVLSKMFGARYERLNPAKKRKRAEGMIWYEESCIVVEVKARRISDAARYQQRSEDGYVQELLNRGLNEAIQQIRSTVCQLSDGTLSCQSSGKPRVVGSLIVVTEEIPLSIIAESVLNDVLPRNQSVSGMTMLRPQVIGLSELELLDQWQSRRLIDVLERKMRDENTSVESLTGYRHLTRQVASEPTLQHCLMDGLSTLVKRWIVSDGPNG